MNAKYLEKEVSIVNENFRLEGTLCSPVNHQAKFSILLIGGSGRGDRNQNWKSATPNVFNDLAHQLAESGIQTLRYDKRRNGASEGDYFEVGHTELVSDGIAWARYLISQRESEQQSLLVLGHSEGALIGPKVVDKLDDIQGLILVCPSFEDFTTLLERQMDESLIEIKTIKGIQGMIVRFVMLLKGDIKTKQRKLHQRIQATNKNCIREGFKKVNAKWFRDNMALDMRDIYSKIRINTLVIAGEKDVQCRPGDAKKIAELDPTLMTEVTIPDLSHILKREPGTASILRYGYLFNQPVDERVVTAIVGWLDSRKTTDREPVNH